VNVSHFGIVSGRERETASAEISIHSAEVSWDRFGHMWFNDYEFPNRMTITAVPSEAVALQN
jgi:hypothetical protein